MKNRPTLESGEDPAGLKQAWVFRPLQPAQGSRYRVAVLGGRLRSLAIATRGTSRLNRLVDWFPMIEIWLKPNRRVLTMGLVPALVLVGLGGLGLARIEAEFLRGVCWGVIFAGAVLVAGLMLQMFRPRVAYRDENVLFFLRAGDPVAVPVKVVEAFFLGQGPAYLPGQQIDSSKAVNLVARLSQKAPQWQEVEVKSALGHWREGYVTIRGTWCEPLTGELIRRLNHRLHEVTKQAEATVAN